ncbi:MAG: hypothetical protein GF334_09405 [Candidatus Altiarchaeales archaeon]|nr:hypothetical protein [Candidatus Altiarchaeales archaeon]
MDPYEWEYLEEEDLCRVYLIGDGECIKIGISYNPSYRLKIMQTGNSRELVLFATFPGGEKEEEYLHSYFKSKHKRGEWYFLDDQDILRIFGYFSGVELK